MEYTILTPWSRVLLEKLTGFQPVKKFPAFHGTRRFVTAFTSARHLSLFWGSFIQSIPQHPISWRSILIQGDTKNGNFWKTQQKLKKSKKKIIDRNWTIKTCLLRDSNPNYQCLKITSCRWRPPRMHSFTASTHFKISRSFVSPCVCCMLCRMRKSRILCFFVFDEIRSASAGDYRQTLDRRLISDIFRVMQCHILWFFLCAMLLLNLGWIVTSQRKWH